MASTTSDDSRPPRDADPFVLVNETMLYASSAKTRGDLPAFTAARPGSSSNAVLPPRSKWGCLTCKAKHAKCDETKPECLACAAKGIKCGGYGPGIRWSTKHEKFKGSRTRGGSSGGQAGSRAGRGRQKRPAPRRPASPLPTDVQPTDVRPTTTSTTATAPELEASEHDWRALQLPILSTALSSFPIWDDQSYNFHTSTGAWAADSPRTNPALYAGVSVDQLHADVIPSVETAAGRLFRSTGPPVVSLLPPHQQAGRAAISPHESQFDTAGSEDAEDAEDGEDGEDVQDADDACRDVALAHQPEDGEPFLLPNVVHTPSRLINYWFQEVCSVWSAYDSHMNLNRTIASVLWHDSETVSVSLKSMSAAFLASRLPYMRKTSFAMAKEATNAIKKELSVTKSLPQLTAMPTGLIFALFCVGTTMCWLDGRQLGIPFLREAKALLRRMNQQRGRLSVDDQKLLKFFNKSWTYCEMLLAVVTFGELQGSGDGTGSGDGVGSGDGIGSLDDNGGGNDDDDDDDDDPDNPGGERPRPRPQPQPSTEHVKPDIIPHPWTGISATPSRLFARAVSLCRNFRREIKWERGVTAQDLQTALDKIEESKAIEEQLLGLDYETRESLNDTGDQNTPYQHLVLAGEAYRLAALVHLYQTFPDLVTLRLPRGLASASDRGQVPWDDWIIPLTLRLVDIIEQMPPESGSKMVQPLLCITAGTGLRLNGRRQPAPETAESARQRIATAVATESRILEYIRGLGQASDEVPPAESASQARVRAARQFLLDRLDVLETSLPPNPIIVARDLVRAIWRAYDQEPPGVNAVHWVDVMEQQNLRSFFG